ncbi:haloacid dehalogenase type II [Pseudozobellia thermophila]|uniref:2-haloacid dehalogenase n=1 Tax=Pseudozobellia thermophila TaxID=192903 RepID=A0A1M6MBE1_9FLAO|nr:haloacid dehalogenase type II [Pseudozobellia thermophila]SHJ80776.1 2-haloacid dehalogenase [Pseudozobellia thermophila]
MKKQRPKVLFFDVNETLLDLAPMKKKMAHVLGGNGNLLSLWFTTLLQYTLVTSASGRYKDFVDIGAATLQMVAANHGMALTKKEARQSVSSSLLSLPAHPEVKGALTALKKAGYRLAAFTNGSNEGVKAQFEFAGLTDHFEERLSVEDAGKSKPFGEAYEWAARTMNVDPEDCMMIAAHGWDVAGAQWAGWRAAFIERPGQQLFPLAPRAEIVETDLMKVADILIEYR